ncbi:NUDIX hydrolase [Fervidobacterium sp. 2310opik-2]|uniref:NUDIX domain-containing protein n=1 Tax=Fervidobacterium sp. 2310opik-2 TaxID=1755815 RepID=UPI0013DF9A41|nr:NUDIX hydrolase [Fervidobacterium sp. 2310opik-2]KAF2961598.1 ADP-ribose pyrophosphatase [Fervidobacterium sp. 2310opik-2]HOJ93630.1 NUDIX hydrolase [Fervidobacterium nodosum]
MEKTITTSVIFNGMLLRVLKDEVVLENGVVTTREYVQHPGAVAVVPVTDDGKIILVEQYRYPIKQMLLEIPAGKFDKPGENPLECAKRELEEETGYRAQEYTYLGYIHTTPGFSNEVIHLYLARKLYKGTMDPDEDEILKVHIKDFDETVQKCINGEITDVKTIVGIMRAYFKLRGEK